MNDLASTESADGRWWLLLSLAPLLVAVDQLTKRLADAYLSDHPAGLVPVVEGFFMLRHSRNRGAFFSLGEGMPDGIRVAFFTAAALLALAFVFFIYRRTTESQHVMRWGLMLLATGAVGNLIDRLARGEVVDFLHLHYRDHFHWATFNVADIYITIGLILLLVDAFLAPAEERVEATGKP